MSMINGIGAVVARLASSLGSSLVSYIQSGVGAVKRSIQDRLRETIYAADYGVVGGGVVDDTTTLQAALTASVGKRLVIPPNDYKVTAGLTAPASAVIDAKNAWLVATTHFKMLTVSDNCSVRELGFEGPGGYNSEGFGIYGSGVRNGAGVAPTRLAGVDIYKCKFKDIGNIGADLDFAENSRIERCTGENIGYAGAFVYSGKNVRVDFNDFDTILGETGSGELNAYGITFTSLVNTSDFVRDPQSTKCTAFGNKIKNVPTWHGIDTHGGTFIDIICNELEDCRRGVILTNLTTAGAEDCTVTGNVLRNTLTGTNSNGSQKQGEAFWDVGASASVRNKRNFIVGNKVYQHGSPTESVGAAYIENAEDGACDENLLKEPFNYGIVTKNNVRRYSLSKNNIIDPKGAGVAGSGPTDYPSHMLFSGTDFYSITVANNIFARVNAAVAAKVGEIAINIGNTALKSLKLKQNTFDGVVSEYSIPELTGVTGDLFGSFDATLTGCTTSPTVTVNYRITDDIVSLRLSASVSATSNATTMTLTGMPSLLWPSAEAQAIALVTDNGANEFGIASVATNGVINCYRGASLSAFTASGTKGFGKNVITYAR